MRKIGSLLLASVLALATHVAMAKTSFNLSTPDPDNSEITLAAKKFAEIVAAKTGGEVEVKVFPNGQLYGGDPSAAFWLWEDTDVPVSASGYGGKTLNGIRIGPVYTPPQHRGRGYATSLVAAQSQWLLDSGYRFCFLYTDLANPTSNAVYQRIGYRQVAESAQDAFTSA